MNFQNHVLFSKIALPLRGVIKRALDRQFPKVYDDALRDPWPVVVDAHGFLCWDADPMVSQLVATEHMPPLDMDMVFEAVRRGDYSEENYRRLMKRAGFPLKYYYENCASLAEMEQAAGNINVLL